MAENLDSTKPSGISKHLYSTNPDMIVGENIYSRDKTSINKEESYQTLDNRTIPVDTQQKVNPFNVKGVPGCTRCGGSGWREDKGPPHPCNECAKKTVPVIDTHLTKVGHTQTPVVQAETIVSKEIPVTTTKIEETAYTKHIPATTTTVAEDSAFTREMPVGSTYRAEQTSTHEIQGGVKTNVEQHYGEIEQVKEVSVKRPVHYTEEVPVTTKVPVTKYEEITKNVPIEKTEYVTETVPVTTKVPVVEEITTTSKLIPLNEANINNNIKYNKTTDTSLTTGEAYRTGPTVIGSGVERNMTTGTTLTTGEAYKTGSTGIESGVERNLTTGTTLTSGEGYRTGPTVIDTETERNRILLEGTHLHDEELKHGNLQIRPFQGVPGCKECGGDGWRRSKLTGAKKPCRHCIEVTGNCPLCNNTGMRIDKNKKCKCMYGKNLTI